MQGIFQETEKRETIGKRMQDVYLASRTKEELLDYIVTIWENTDRGILQNRRLAEYTS